MSSPWKKSSLFLPKQGASSDKLLDVSADGYGLHGFADDSIPAPSTKLATIVSALEEEISESERFSSGSDISYEIVSYHQVSTTGA